MILFCLVCYHDLLGPKWFCRSALSCLLFLEQTPCCYFLTHLCLCLWDLPCCSLWKHCILNLSLFDPKVLNLEWFLHTACKKLSLALMLLGITLQLVLSSNIWSSCLSLFQLHLVQLYVSLHWLHAPWGQDVAISASPQCPARAWHLAVTQGIFDNVMDEWINFSRLL